MDHYIACPDCDLLYEHVPAEPDQVVSCWRCGHTLLAPQKDSIDKTLSLSLSGLILFFPSVFLPIMTLEILGQEKSGSIFQSIIAFYDSGYLFVSIMVAATGLLFPLAKLSLLFYISLALKLKWRTSSLPVLMRMYHHLEEWGMVEVFVVGILVSIIKLYHMATILYDPGMFCFVILMLATLGSSSAMDSHHFWDLIEKNRDD